MAETKHMKIEKKSYAILQEALFEKDGNGSYVPRDMAKEGMTTLKKHSTSLVVVCTDSSVEDVTELLKKNEIPHDNVIKMEGKFDYLVTGKDQSVSVYSWESALDDSVVSKETRQSTAPASATMVVTFSPYRTTVVTAPPRCAMPCISDTFTW